MEKKTTINNSSDERMKTYYTIICKNKKINLKNIKILSNIFLT